MVQKENAIITEYVAIAGYSFIYLNCVKRTDGRVGAYIKQNLVFQERKDLHVLNMLYGHNLTCGPSLT